MAKISWRPFSHKDLVNFDNIERYGYAFTQIRWYRFRQKLSACPRMWVYIGLDGEIKHNVVNDWFNPQMNGCHVPHFCGWQDVYPDWGRQINMKRHNLICHDKKYRTDRKMKVVTLKAAADRLRVGNRPLYLKDNISDSNWKVLKDYCKWERDFQVSITYEVFISWRAANGVYRRFIAARHQSRQGFKNRFVCRVDERSMTNHFLDDGICKIFIQLIFLRSHKLNFSLIYEDNYFMQQGWGKVIDFFELLFL